METAQRLIKENKVMVFSKSYCPFCTKAKQVLNSINVKYELIELDEDPNGAEIQQALEQLTGQRTVPNVFVGQKSIGGGSETAALHAQGKLVPMLKDVGALWNVVNE